MYQVFSRLDDFYSRRTGTVQLTFKTCGNIFLLFGLLTMASASWKSYVAIAMGLGGFLFDYVFSWVLQAVALLGVAVVAALVMHAAARNIAYEPCDEKSAYRRAGLALLLLAVVMFSPLLTSLIHLLFPFRPVLYMLSFSSGPDAFTGILPAVKGTWWSPVTGLVHLLFSLSYVLLSIGNLWFAVRMLGEGYANYQIDRPQGLISWIRIQYRRGINSVLDSRLNSAPEVIRTSAYLFLGITAVIVLPALLYQVAVVLFLGKNTLISEVWLAGGTQVSGTAVVSVVTAILFYLLCASVTGFSSWRMFRKSTQVAKGSDHLPVLKNGRKWLRRSSIAAIVLTLFLFYSSTSAHKSYARTGLNTPVPILLFATSTEAQKSRRAQNPQQINVSVTQFLWLQCVPLLVMAWLFWIASSRMRRKVEQIEHGGPRNEGERP